MDFVFTRLAEAFARAKYSVESVRNRAESELQQLRPDASADSRFLQCFGMSEGRDRPEFAVLTHEGRVFIDTVSYHEEVIDAGPFKGKTVAFPAPDTFTAGEEC